MSKRTVDHTIFGNDGAIVTYETDEYVFHEGSRGDALFIVVEGAVRVTLQDRQIDYLTAGTIFGEMALVDELPRSASVIAATDCKLLRIDHANIGSLIHKHPDLGVSLMMIMSERLRRLMDEEVKRQRMEEELLIGQKIQQSLLPRETPTIPGWEFGQYYNPARQVGGDLYDYITRESDKNLLDIVVADVTGKGVPAALFMASMRAVFRTLARNDHDPAETLRQANRSIVHDIRSRFFLSTFYLTLNVKTGDAVFANGGHELPIWYRAQNDSIDHLNARGFLLGAFAELRRETSSAQIAPGDFVVFYTDGITEARDRNGKLFGEERLHEVILAGRHDSAAQLCERIRTAVTDYVGNQPQSDDLTLVVLKRKPA